MNGMTARSLVSSSLRRRHPRTSILSLLAATVAVAGLTAAGPPETNPHAPGWSTGEESPLVIHVEDPSTQDPGEPATVAEIDDARGELRDGTTWQLETPDGLAASGAGGVSVHYVTTDQATLPPPDVQAVVDEAVRRWNQVLDTSAPIVVDFAWFPLGNNLLGAGGPTTIHRNGLPPAEGTYYPAALANHLAGFDVNGPSNAEIEIILDSNRYASGGWYTDLDGSNPPFGSRDLLSTVIHEIGHGLGFLGSAVASGGGGGEWGSPQLVYDLLGEFQGSRLVDLGNGEARLTSGAVDVDLGGGLLFELYAPGTFITGSSFSHFDEANHPAGTAGALMTPVLSSGELERTIDGATLAVLWRIGWDLSVTVAQPTITSVTGGTDGRVALTWEAPFGSGNGLPATGYTLRVYDGAELVTSATFPADGGAVNLSGLDNFADHRFELTANHPAAVDQTDTVYSDGRPGYVGVSGSATARTIAWPAPNGAGTQGATYQVERRVVGSTTWTRIANPSGRTITDSGLAEGVYQWRVRVVSAAGTSDWRLSSIEGVAADVDRPMPLDGQVARLYAASLGRTADSSGLSFWIDQRIGGQGLEVIASQFATSNEFVAAYGSLGDADFVDLVYQNVLGRAPDAEGRTFWIDQLATGRSRGSMIVGFSESPEYVAATATGALQSSSEGQVYRLYLAYFLREPDAQGFGFWVDQVAAGADLRAASQAFAQSPEFVDTYGDLADERFVDLVYRNVLGREPDASGRASWIAALAAGLPRGELMVGFSESPEFVLQTGTTP